ncbi:hypothetical protein ACSAZL_15865 [Methanosarcina sp. T3]|uniref:hypothetical protein n=1 Tax=Methanosarcina sp. T3 TaxID=3439062 RepID=UPI003F85EAF7
MKLGKRNEKHSSVVVMSFLFYGFPLNSSVNILDSTLMPTRMSQATAFPSSPPAIYPPLPSSSSTPAHPNHLLRQYLFGHLQLSDSEIRPLSTSRRSIEQSRVVISLEVCQRT